MQQKKQWNIITIIIDFTLKNQWLQNNKLFGFKQNIVLQQNKMIDCILAKTKKNGYNSKYCH